MINNPFDRFERFERSTAGWLLPLAVFLIGASGTMLAVETMNRIELNEQIQRGKPIQVTPEPF